MRKNQKHTRAQMFRGIEQCKEAGCSHMQYCKQEGIPYQTFKYWVKKYHRERNTGKPKEPTFVPVQVAMPVHQHQAGKEPGCITIIYPNGIQVNCPVGIPSALLKTLLIS